MSATTIERSYTTPKQPGGITGKGFAKGDARIDRKGRPRSSDELRKLAQAIAHETTTDNQGNKITTIVAILRSWARSKQPSLQIAFVEYAYGKVPNKLETNPLEKKTTIILRHAHELPEREAGRRLPAWSCIRPKLGNEPRVSRFPFVGSTPANVREIGGRMREGIAGYVGISRKTREKALLRGLYGVKR